MKVLIIHEHGNPAGSGAVVSTWRLHRGLLDAGIESTLACRRPAHDSDDVVELPRADTLERWLGRVTWRMGLNDVHCVSAFKLTSFRPFLEADVVNIHGWHSNFLSYLALPRLARAKPVVASLHDMWNFTGHCATSLDCERWTTGCGQCPYPAVFPPVPRDATALEWKLKDWVYRHSEMMVTTPARALARQIERSMLSRFPIRVVPNGIDAHTLRPRDRAACRTELGLPQDRIVIQFGAANLANRLKGPDLVRDAINGLPADVRARVTLLLTGDGGAELAAEMQVPVVDLGFVPDEETKAKCFAAADVFLLPTRAEVQGRVCVEALSCGTPCVASDVGGVGESVITGRTGYLSRPDDVADVQRGLLELIADPELRARCGAEGRRMVLEHHADEVSVRMYLEVFEEAIAAHRRAAA